MHWAEGYVGCAYEPLGRGPRTFDCLGLFLALQRKRHGRRLPDPGVTMTEAVRENTAQSYREMFREIDRTDVEEGDALLFRHRGHALHVGYALNGRDMLHASMDSFGVAIDRWTASLWLSKLVGAYRYA